MKTFSNALIKYAGIITLFGLITGVIGGFYSVKLFANLRTDLEELLPTTARSVLDLGEATRRLEAIENLALVIVSNNTKASKRFVDDLAAELKPVPKTTIASVEYKIDNELRFFQNRKALYMELGDLRLIRNYLRDRIDYEKNLFNPLSIFRSTELPEPLLDFKVLEKKYQKKSSAYSRFPNGYYANPDETKRVVLVYLPGKTGGVDALHRLKNAVVDAVTKLKPESYASDLQVLYTGGVQNTIEEQAALVADLALSTIIVAIVTLCLLFWFFKRFRVVMALAGSLLIGTLWTFGAAYMVVGYLNANSAFLASIVIGNGINFGIIYLARYMEERRANLSHEEATEISIKNTATSTWVAALAAGLSYGSLMLTRFRGFSQFGVIGLIGMVLCWISAFTLMPAFLTMMERRRSLMKALPNRRAHDAGIMAPIAALIKNFPGIIVLLSAAATLWGVLGIHGFSSDLIEANLEKLRDKRSMQSGSGYLSKYVDEVFQRYLSPLVLLPRNGDDVEKIADILRKQKEKEGDQSLIANVQTIRDFLPAQQPEKIKVLKEIENLLPPRLVRNISPTDKNRIREFLVPESFQPIEMKDLPELILSKFREKDGSVGKLVLVEPPLDDRTRKAQNLIQFIADIRKAGDSIAPGTPLAGGLPISADMISSISEDGPRATLFAFLAVVLLVIILFRNFATSFQVLFALIIGMIWLGGIIFHFDIKINFLNFIALPITFGIGVDYGVNIFQRYRQEGGQNILKVIRESGGAVVLCSLTTVTGYGSLLIAGNQAFVSFGLLAVLGELTCLIGAVLTLPAMLLYVSRRKKKVTA